MTDQPPFTARNVSKFVVRMTVQLQTANLVRNTIADHTSMEATDTSVAIAGGVVGWFVADKLKPVTDLSVDKTADFITATRTKFSRKSKKSETE
jgi:hypothetical protein